MMVGKLIKKICFQPDTETFLKKILNQDKLSILDVGSGVSSYFEKLGKNLNITQIDIFAQPQNKLISNCKFQFVLGDIRNLSAEALLNLNQGVPFDVVTMIHVIEHLEKDEGIKVLQKLESISSQFIFVETPNGYTEQGEDYGNPFQKHLSGWEAFDFTALGFKVYGTTGTKFLKGYGSGPKFKIKGISSADLILSWILQIKKNHKFAYNLVAIKKVI